jgi:hypothetical protein
MPRYGVAGGCREGWGRGYRRCLRRLSLASEGRTPKEAATVAVARRRGDLLAGGLPSRLRHCTGFRCRICDTAVASSSHSSAQAYQHLPGPMPVQAPAPIAKRQSARGEGYHGTAMEVPGTRAAAIRAGVLSPISPPSGTTIMGLPPRPSFACSAERRSSREKRGPPGKGTGGRSSREKTNGRSSAGDPPSKLRQYQCQPHL